MLTRNGYLTVYSADRSEIYGEFVDGLWETEKTAGGTNYVFSGTPSEGTMNTFRRINTEGIVNVAYLFDSNGYRYGGSAQLLAPAEGNGRARIQIETGTEPSRV